ncbi:hypothetical protein EV421DRAFT_1827726 [Armillaria borealis]|uniref:F-box domain-containing protein n=1 Tax=Armillaria borealis TaxID=47425 RepID=A0AA39ML36_9AGAR|nr:hypothetical protein EV421DRAFT_1827726 [Armillaria borealis]
MPIDQIYLLSPMSSTSPIQSSIPMELIEEILDRVECLPDTQSHSSEGYKGWRAATLDSCSLVCRAWLPRSRYHLFGFVHVTPQKLCIFLAARCQSILHFH